MRPSADPATPTPHGTASFAVTRWSVVLAAGQSDSGEAREALDQLCRLYWRPIYCFVRHRGYKAEDARDLTQEFFARLLSKNSLANVAPSKGRFRTFLLAALKHYLANEWDKATSKKRGGGRVFVPLDAAVASSGAEPADNETAEVIFDREWALALLAQVMGRLREEYARDGKADLFERLKATLVGARTELPYAAIGPGLGMTEGAVKVAVHRLRQRYRQLLREEIAHTLSRPDQADEELRALFAALS